MPRRRSILDYRLREVIPMLGLVVLVLNIIGYFGGFLLVDFNARTARKQFQQGDSLHAGQNFLETSDLLFVDNFQQTRKLRNQTRMTKTPNLIAPQRNTPVFKNLYNTQIGLSKSVVQHSEPCVFRDGRDPADGRWYNFTVPGYKFYAYSALVDDRDSILSAPVLRIIGLGSKVEDEVEVLNVRLYCRLRYTGGQSEYVEMNQAVTKIGQGWVLNNEWVREYVFTCPIPMSKIPQAVTVVDVLDDAVASCMPVEVPRKAAKKDGFAICVQVAFDKVNPYRLTEWLELQWLLGVRRVGIYNLKLDKDSIEVLAHYAKEGYVDLRKSDYIEHGPEQHLLHGSPVINDCYYRHMHLFNYIAVIDFDEVIMPRLGLRSLEELVEVLRANYSTLPFPPLNYIFYNNFYFLDIPPDTSISPYLTMLRYRKKAPVSPFGYSVKSILHSEACLGVHNHFCWTLAPKYAKEHSYPYVVDYSIAVNHHYKRCHLNATECQELVDQSTQDDIILQFKGDLQRRVNEKILTIKGHNI